MPLFGKRVEIRTTAARVRMHWPIVVCIICMSCIAIVVGQAPQENLLSSNGDDKHIAFDQPDLTVMMLDDEGHTYVVEAFKSVKNDRIFQELGTSPAKSSQLLWVSNGHPVFSRSVDGRNSSNFRLFHQAEDEFFVQIQMLTETHKIKLVNRARERYGLNVTEDQFVLLPLTYFECKLKLYDSASMPHIISGKVGNFKRIPFRMDFEVPKHRLERSMFSAKLMDDSATLRFDCSMSAGGKLMKTNTLIIESQQLEEIGLFDKLFGAAENVYVTRNQMSELAREMYSTLNIIEDYQMSEHTFSEAFIDGLISQLSSEQFKNVPFDTAISSLSRYTFDVNSDLQPDVIKRNLSTIFKVVQDGNKAHIIASSDIEGKGASNSDMAVYAALKVKYGIIDESLEGKYDTKNSGSWSSQNKSVDDQLKELNQLHKNSIEWEIEGNRVIAKSLNVARLYKARLTSRLTFSRVQVRSFYAPFSRSFTLYTRDAVAAASHSDQVAATEHRLCNISDKLERRIQSLSDQQRVSDMSHGRLEVLVQNLLTTTNSTASAIDRLASSLRCAPDFFYSKAVNGCYKPVAKAMTWDEAASACKSANPNSHLAFIDSSQEQNAVMTLLAGYNDPVCSIAHTATSIFGNAWWIGFQRLTSASSTFVAKSSGSSPGYDHVMSYSNWMPAQPDNGAEDCVHMAGASSFKWNDARCSTKLCFVCEIVLH